MSMYQLVIEGRISVLLAARALYRRNGWAGFPGTRADIELRALVTLARAARKAQAPDPMDVAKAYGLPEDMSEWTSGELVAVFGR